MDARELKPSAVKDGIYWCIDEKACHARLSSFLRDAGHVTSL